MGPIWPVKCAGPRNDMFERQSQGHSPMFTVWTSDLRSTIRGRTMTSLLKRMMHTSSITLIVTPWSSKAMMANNNVYRILVDNGMSVDILCY